MAWRGWDEWQPQVGQRVAWTADGGRIGAGDFLWDNEEGWATVELDDGQLVAIPCFALRPAAQGNQLTLL